MLGIHSLALASSHELSLENEEQTEDKHVVVSKLKAWRYLATNQTVVHLSLSVPKETIWHPGEAITILPQNDSAVVDHILTTLKVSPDGLFLSPEEALKSDDKNQHPSFLNAPIYKRLIFPITNRNVLLYYVSLRIHNKNILNVLLSNTANTTEIAILKSWIQQSTEWGQYLEERVGVVDLLEKFKDATPTFRHIIEHLMVLQPRSYSVASAKCVDDETLSIAFKLVNGGVCTNWLHGLCLEHKNTNGYPPIEIPITFRKSEEFRLPSDSVTPMIMIGPGTGVSPFIPFLQQRSADMALGKPIGENHLFFGCRSSEKDYLFKEELMDFQERKVLEGLHVAFSQESSGGLWYGGCYVQDKLQGCSTHICNMIMNEGAYIYVCGDENSMAKGIHRVLVDMIDCYMRSWSTEEATQYLMKLLEDGRYQRDIWS